MTDLGEGGRVCWRVFVFQDSRVEVAANGDAMIDLTKKLEFRK